MLVCSLHMSQSALQISENMNKLAIWQQHRVLSLKVCNNADGRSFSIYVPWALFTAANFSLSSMFPQLDVPSARCSLSSMFPQFYVPSVLCSLSSMFSQLDVPSAQWSLSSRYSKLLLNTVITKIDCKSSLGQIRKGLKNLRHTSGFEWCSRSNPCVRARRTWIFGNIEPKGRYRWPVCYCYSVPLHWLEKWN